MAGAAALARRAPRLFAGTLLLYAASGPLFLFLANMPPNPHALAIVEPHYLLTDLLLALWAAQGAAWLAERTGARWAAGALAVVCLLTAAAQGRFARMDRRWDLFAHDWADGALRSVPPGAALIAKKDVQIFALWHHQKVLGRRPEVTAVAQGLAHSPWHQESLRRARADVVMGGLRSRAEWEAFVRANPAVYATPDAEVPAGVRPGMPRGLAAPVPARAESAPDPAPFLLCRGDCRYEARPDFFSADLVESYALARQTRGIWLATHGAPAEARRELTAAWALKHRSPEAVDFLGFLALSSGDAAAAAVSYEAAARLYDRTMALAAEYNALPDTRRGIRMTAADSAVNMGVAYEKSRRRDLAEAAYARALALRPDLARAHFNMAVLYWDRDWKRVVAELEAAQAANPGDPEPARFLLQARARLTVH